LFVEMFAPETPDDIVDVVHAAIANAEPLEVGCNFTRRGLGRPVEAARRRSVRGLRGVHFYEPSELVVSVRPGTTMRELVDLLDQNGQELAFEPIDLSRLYGGEPLGGTVGGTVATNGSGPRRIKAGAVRDHMLGFTAVSGRGDIFQSGGRVMKNVTGYDLSKLMTGSYGTLAVLVDLTLKVLPKAEMEETLVLHGLDDTAAVDVMTAASGSPHEVSSFAHVPAGIAGRLPEPASRSDGAITALRLEGPEVSVVKRRDDLKAMFADRGAEFSSIDRASSRTFWQLLRDCAPLADQSREIWRLSVAPTEGPAVVDAIRSAEIGVEHYYDWAGGLVWIASETAADTAAPIIRRAIAANGGGHATLMRADQETRSTTPVFQPQPAPLAALTSRIKESFDPERILNRGRMREDM